MRKIILFLSIFTISLFSQELPPPVSDPHITDDYGPRNVGGIYDFHKGIDYRASPGTTVRAVEGGEIVFIRSYADGDAGGWRIRIHGAHAYWTYMHLFSNNNNPISPDERWEARSGILVDPNTGQPNPTNPVYMFISWVDRENNIAERVLSSYSGRYIQYNGDYLRNQNGERILTQGSVGAQEAIGPSGNSGRVEGPHLHISAGSSNEAYDDINPLYHIIHSAPNYTLNILKPEENALFYHLPGAPESEQLYERIKDSIDLTVDTDTNNYDLDRVFVYLFDDEESRTFDNAHLYAKIVYGGLPPGEEYSEPFPLERMVVRRNENGRGSLTRTGVDPMPHATPSPPGVDNFYYIGGFSEGNFQFNSKINKAGTGDALLNERASSNYVVNLELGERENSDERDNNS